MKLFVRHLIAPHIEIMPLLLQEFKMLAFFYDGSFIQNYDFVKFLNGVEPVRYGNDRHILFDSVNVLNNGRLCIGV